VSTEFKQYHSVFNARQNNFSFVANGTIRIVSNHSQFFSFLCVCVFSVHFVAGDDVILRVCNAMTQ
jgi:hypothetical protein